jgi:hypothetical protein
MAYLMPYTPSVPNYVTYNFWSKSNFLKVDQMYSKKNQLLQCQINVITIIMKHTFILYTFGIVGVIFCAIYLVKIIRFDFS